MKMPSSELRIQICKCIINFYHAEPPKKHITGKVFNSLSVIIYVFIKQNIRSHFPLNLERHSGIINETHQKQVLLVVLSSSVVFKQKNLHMFLQL